MKKIGILGTGDVGRRIASRLVKLGYEVKIGSRTATNEKAMEWVSQNGENASAGTFTDAVAFGDIIFNCTKGEIALTVIEMAGIENFTGKTVADITNPLELNNGMPITLLPQYINTTSVAEEVQKLLPKANVVKTLNIVNSELMANGENAPAGTTMMLCGNNEQAKDEIKTLLTQFGWKDILDLGDLTGARAMEMYSAMWLSVFGATQNVNFTITINR